MMKIYQVIVRKPTTPPRRNVDPEMRFTPRDWADLPPHHPRTDRE